MTAISPMMWNPEGISLTISGGNILLRSSFKANALNEGKFPGTMNPWIPPGMPLKALIVKTKRLIQCNTARIS